MTGHPVRTGLVPAPITVPITAPTTAPTTAPITAPTTAPITVPITVLTGTALPTAAWSAWSCVVRLVVSDPSALRPAAADLQALMNRVERAASRFQVSSELSRANANAGRPTVVSRTLVELVTTALGAASQSSGAVDPTLGADLDRIGYDRDISLIGDSESAVRPASPFRPSWRDVGLDPTFGLLTVPRGCALDLGATAKAQTADWAAAQLARRYACPVLVEIGGDVAVAGDKTDWQLTVAERNGDHGQQITVRGGGVATSTTTVRRWRRGADLVSHLIDPATGSPAAGRWRTASVAADSCVHANTCSTAAIVLGDEAMSWLTEQRVAARLVDRAGQVVTLGGWPQDQPPGDAARVQRHLVRTWTC
ncbi:MAG TPA: FAD:protein FMN transferase [Jatrophihabitans sp.]